MVTEDLRGLVRDHDHSTSIAAGVHQEQHRTKLQERIYQVFLRTPDGLTDEELRFHPEFAADDYAESTVRKRRTELEQRGLLVDTGVTRINRSGMAMTVWGLAKQQPPPIVRRLRPVPPVVKKRG
jgi:uncharacterized protein YwgA